MLIDLSCPKCGAPLTIESGGDGSVVVCNFCNTTSILSADGDREAKLVMEPAARRADPIPPVAGTSLWADAWKRLLKNKLSVFGMVVLIVMVLLVTVGPTVI